MLGCKAMITCQECGFSYDETLDTCPECGISTPRMSKKEPAVAPRCCHCPFYETSVAEGDCKWCGHPAYLKTTPIPTEKSGVANNLYHVFLNECKRIKENLANDPRDHGDREIFVYGYLGDIRVMQIFGYEDDEEEEGKYLPYFELHFYAENGFSIPLLSEAEFDYDHYWKAWTREFGFNCEGMAKVATDIMTKTFGEDASIRFEDGVYE